MQGPEVEIREKRTRNLRPDRRVGGFSRSHLLCFDPQYGTRRTELCDAGDHGESTPESTQLPKINGLSGDHSSEDLARLQDQREDPVAVAK
jgi:hypothetical protein